MKESIFCQKKEVKNLLRNIHLLKKKVEVKNLLRKEELKTNK